LLKSRFRPADNPSSRREYMSGRIYQLFVAAVVGILGVATARAERGYLPQAGPLPLRFRLPPAVPHQVAPTPLPSPPVAPILLPAPPMPPAPPETTNAAPAKPIQVPTNAPAVEFEAREPLAVSPSNAVPEGAISPQMLIKYFTSPTAAATNAPGIGAAPPVIGFTPPAVPAPAPPPPK
jgi:hypothetical protein